MVHLFHSESAPPLAITAHSMVTSLGLDAATSASAARAGIRRAQPLDYYEFRSPDGREPEFAIGHPVPIITHGFEGAARLVQLAKAALKGLPAPTAAEAKRGGFYLSMPSFNRPWTMLDRIPDPETRKTWEDERDEEALTEEEDDEAVRDVMNKAVAGTGWQDVPIRFVTRRGRSGFIAALAAGIKDCREGRIGSAIIGAFDSLLDKNTLLWLDRTAQLKTQSNPVGIEPGEAAAIVVVRIEPGSATTMVEAVFSAKDEPHRQDLAELLRPIRKANSTSEPDEWLVTEHAGTVEDSELTAAFLAECARLPGYQTVMPDSTFGETAAASGAMQLLSSYWLLAKRRATDPTAVTVFSLDQRACAAVKLRGAEVL